MLEKGPKGSRSRIVVVVVGLKVRERVMVGWSAELSEAVLCLLRDSVNASVCDSLELG